MPRSIPTSNDPSLAGAPSCALVPALATSTSVSPRSIDTLRAIASASGLRQVLPVQTNRIFMNSRVSDQIGHALAQRCRGNLPGADHARRPSGAIEHSRGLRFDQTPAVEHAKLTA